MRKIAVIIASVIVVAGCATCRVPKSRELELEEALAVKAAQIAQQEEAIAKKNDEISSLQVLLSERDKQLAEKDELMRQLRKRLEGFGVFE